MKGKATEDFCADPTAPNPNPNAGLRTRSTKAVDNWTDLEWLAMQDYLDDTEKLSLATAHRVDLAIEKEFPGAPKGKVLEKWKAYLRQVKHVSAQVLKQVENDIECVIRFASWLGIG